MTYFLDTNICIDFLRGRNPALVKKLKTLQPKDILISAIVKAELLTGAAKSQDPKRQESIVLEFLEPFEVVAFDSTCSYDYAKVRSVLEQAGDKIGPNDLIIAATVLAHDGILVTSNTREFERVAKLRVESWDKPME